MESIQTARDKIYNEVTAAPSDVRDKYLKQFGPQVTQFANNMAEAFIAWQAFDEDVKEDKEKALVSALVYSAITLHIVSMRLFIEGHIVASGAIARQVIESIAMSLLCSRKDLGVLSLFENDRYSTNHAVTHLVRRAKQLSLKNEGLAVLVDAHSFYHKYAHVTKLTIAAGASFTGEGLFVGASFDEGKLEAYEKEVAGRVSLSGIMKNFIAGVTSQVAKWQIPSRPKDAST